MKVLQDHGDWQRLECLCGCIFNVDPTVEENLERVYKKSGVVLYSKCPECQTWGNKEVYNYHFVCIPCRNHFKGTNICPSCQNFMECKGLDFIAPKKRDIKAWSKM